MPTKLGIEVKILKIGRKAERLGKLIRIESKLNFLCNSRCGTGKSSCSRRRSEVIEVHRRAQLCYDSRCKVVVKQNVSRFEDDPWLVKKGNDLRSKGAARTVIS